MSYIIIRTVGGLGVSQYVLDYQVPSPKHVLSLVVLLLFLFLVVLVGSCCLEHQVSSPKHVLSLVSLPLFLFLVVLGCCVVCSVCLIEKFY